MFGRKNRYWPEEVVAALKKEFRLNLEKGTHPSLAEIRKIKQLHPSWLDERSGAIIKSKLMHIKGKIIMV